MTSEGNDHTMAALQAMITEMLRKQEENLLMAMTNQRQNIMEEVRSLIDQTPNSTVGATLPATQTSAPQASAPQANLNPISTPTNNTMPTLNLDPFQEGDQTVLTERETKMMERLEAMEKTLKAIKRRDDLIDLDTLSLFLEARLPPKFKMPEMDKFNGTSCPKTHLKMYVGAMKPLGIGNELLAQLFQRTLTGAAMKWFIDLEDA